MKRMSKKEVLEKYNRVWERPENLRFEARLAYLDGRVKWCRELERRARILEKEMLAKCAKVAKAA